MLRIDMISLVEHAGTWTPGYHRRAWALARLSKELTVSCLGFEVFVFAVVGLWLRKALLYSISVCSDGLHFLHTCLGFLGGCMRTFYIYSYTYHCRPIDLALARVRKSVHKDTRSANRKLDSRTRRQSHLNSLWRNVRALVFLGETPNL